MDRKMIARRQAQKAGTVFDPLRSYIGSVDWRAAFSILGKIVTSAVIVMIVGGVFNANLPLVEAYLAGFGLLLHGSWAFGRLTRLFGSSAKRTSPSVNEAHKLESRLPQWAWQVIWGVAIAVANIFSASLIFCAGIPLVVLIFVDDDVGTGELCW